MRGAALLALALLAGVPAGAAVKTAAEAAAGAASALQAAIDSLDDADTARDRVAALTMTIRAYEDGLAATRQALRDVVAREAVIRQGFDTDRARLSRLIGAMMAMQADPAPARLLHPEGPLAAARAGVLLSGVAPALASESEGLRAELAEIGALRSIDEGAQATLERGLAAVQTARAQLVQAAARRDLPQQFTEDPAVLRALLESYDTLDAFAQSLASGASPGESEFAQAKGELSLPVPGRVLRRFGGADAAGVVRPGMVVATRPRALVTAPWAGTIRYRGPLADYGNVMILEPAGGYLLVLAGLDTVFGEIGQVVPPGAPLGLMGGAEAEAAEFLSPVAAEDGDEPEESLYVELRQGGQPVAPEEWFVETRMFP